jgi:hypothetical protein
MPTAGFKPAIPSSDLLANILKAENNRKTEIGEAHSTHGGKEKGGLKEENNFPEPVIDESIIMKWI